MSFKWNVWNSNVSFNIDIFVCILKFGQNVFVNWKFNIVLKLIWIELFECMQSEHSPTTSTLLLFIN
jgi:hypothetical protein